MKARALELLKRIYGPTATFREGQWEAIESVLKRQKTLVVQKTGWGKSLVYFIATKLLRESENAGPTILISPLLALMRNQVETAQALGVQAKTINSDNQEEWADVEDSFRSGTIDLLLVSPERLSNDRFKKLLFEMETEIGMFVVDEAHCISDWGHDFRPDYRRIIRVLQNVSVNIPVLATTATANNRVIGDIREQIGDDLVTFRGPLTRQSLNLQVTKMGTQEERLAWLAETLPKIWGSGIIYCSTVFDCHRVTEWLRSQNIEAYEYHGQLSAEVKQNRERQLLKNELKVLVATIALGMGFDKPDLGFVFHYQTPGSIVAYYQQIGRAGRNLDKAHVVLLVGNEDSDIQRHFIEAAFPSEDNMKRILEVLTLYGEPMTAESIAKYVNLQHRTIEKCLKMLEVDAAVVRVSAKKYERTANQWEMDHNRVVKVTDARYSELERMGKYISTNECLMQFIAHELDDFTAPLCGNCQNCIGKPLLNIETSQEVRKEAITFLRGDNIVIPVKKQWPAGVISISKKKIPEEQRTQIGRALAMYNDSVYGQIVQKERYVDNFFSDELVDATVNLVVNRWDIENPIEWVTFVPSSNSNSPVGDFARRVAQKLALPFHPIIEKTLETQPQKMMRNSAQQANNIYNVFNVNGNCPKGPVLLIDDIVNSGWTFAVCGVKLLMSGSGPVYPYALASTGGGDFD